MSKKKKTNKSKKTKKLSFSSAFNRFELWLAAGIFALAFVTYANTIGHEYALDDNSVLKDSYIVREGVTNVPAIFTQRYRQGYFGDASTMYRPVSIAMFATEWSISKDNPHLYHFINVLMFALGCGLLFLTLRLIMNKYSIWIPIITSALFAVHPLHTEVVANIKSRDELLIFFFGILALFLLWQHLRTKDNKFLFLSLLAYTVALFSKENAINFLGVIPLTLFFFSKLPLDKIATKSLYYLIPTAIFLIIRFKILGSLAGKESDHSPIDNFMVLLPWLEQKATSMLIMGKYLWLHFVPAPLMCDYNYNTIPGTNFGDWKVFLSTIIHVGMAGYAIYSLLKNKNVIAYGILFYLGNMVLYSNFFMLIGAPMGERFAFMGSLGIMIVIAYLLTFFLGKTVDNENINSFSTLTQGKTALMGVCIPIILLFAYMSFDRNMDWKNSYTLYSADIEKAPNGSRMHGYMGVEFVKLAKETDDEAQKKAYYEKAAYHYQTSYEIMPEHHVEAIGRLGKVHMQMGNQEKAAQFFETCVNHPSGQCKGDYYSDYGTMHFEEYVRLSNAGRKDEALQRLQIAKDLFEKAVARKQNYSEGLMNLGSAWGSLGNHAKAETHFRQSLKFVADDELENNVRKMLISSLQLQGKNAEAEIERRKLTN